MLDGVLCKSISYGPIGICIYDYQVCRKELPSLEIQDANVIKRQRALELVSKMEVKPTNNFIEWEKIDRKARTFIIMGLHDLLF
jgi:hypothetical protein